MDKKDEAIIKLNSDYIKLLNSKEYNLGRRIIKYKNIFSHFKIKELFERIKIEKQLKLANRYNDFVNSKNYYNIENNINSGKRVAVYTCITGAYDSIKEPLVIEKNTDYIMFTDKNTNVSNNNWNYKKIDSVLENKYPNFANRYYKMNPFKLFKNYEYAIYVDGNVEIIGNIRNICSIASNCESGIAMHLHPSRNCIYNEAKACEKLKKGNSLNINEQIAQYKREGFPCQFGMREATIIVVDLNNKKAKEIFEMWWDEFCRSQSHRDQISFPYIIWKMGLSMSDVGILGNNKKYNPFFRIHTHDE